MPSPGKTVLRPTSMVVMTSAAAIAAGILVAWQVSWALAITAVIVFILVWLWRPLYVLVLPALWAVMADPVFLQLTGAAGQNVVTRVLDAWTGLAFLAALLTVMNRHQFQRVLGNPASVGVLVLWACFAVAQLLGGNSLDPEKYWQGEARALLYAGWVIVVLALALAPRATRWLGQLMAFMGALAVGKGFIYWVLGIGIYVRTNGYFRLFGSEEATIGLFALAIGLAHLGRVDLGKDRTSWALVFGGGVALLVLSSLRAYWGFAVLAAVLVWIVEARLGMGRSTRLVVGLIAGLGAIFLILRYLGTGFYSAAIAVRVQTLMSGNLSGDASLAYRVAEIGAVESAVNGRWLFGAGLGAIQRTALSLFVGDTALEQTLLRYVHNSFLWAYLKAGVVGVAGVVAYYWGMIAASLKGMRSSQPPAVAATAVGVFATLVALIGTDLFNAHIASARYVVIVGFVVAYTVALSMGSSKEAAAQ